jgi:hypothetical protein
MKLRKEVNLEFIFIERLKKLVDNDNCLTKNLEKWKQI